MSFRRWSLPGFLAAAILFTEAFAGAPETSLRPVPRPAVKVVKPSANAPRVSLRPKARASSSAKKAVQKAVEAAVIEDSIEDDIKRKKSQPLIKSSRYAVARSLRPKKRPRNLNTKVAKRSAAVKVVADERETKVAKPVRYKKRGSVCGVRGIRGSEASSFNGKIRGCGIKDPVKIYEVDGVRLTREALVNCTTAKQFYSWVRKSAKPKIGRKGGGLAQIQVVAGYSCRTRNSRRGAKLSEHAKGNAIDIAGFVLKNGDIMSVERDWRSGSKGRTLKKLHKSACGPFGTVLGPNADRHHQDHFHFDVARHRNGAYCR